MSLYTPAEADALLDSLPDRYEKLRDKFYSGQLDDRGETIELVLYYVDTVMAFSDNVSDAARRVHAAIRTCTENPCSVARQELIEKIAALSAPSNDVSVDSMLCFAGACTLSVGGWRHEAITAIQDARILITEHAKRIDNRTRASG